MIRALYVLAAVLAAMLMLALYVAKTEAQSAQQRIVMMQQGIITERNQITQLQDELAHLESPRRLQRLAREQLGLRPLEPEQEISIAYFDRPSPAVAGSAGDHVSTAQNSGKNTTTGSGGARR